MIEPYMIWIWLGVFIITLIIEAVTQELVSIWFSLGSLVCIVLCLINGITYWVEIIVFVAVSIITLLLTRPVVLKLLKNKIRTTNVDDFIGREVRAICSIKFNQMGEIKINDVIYNAVLAENEKDINEGEFCVIVGIKGNKVVVKPLQKEI